MLFGLIGKKLSHSFSATLFHEKFYPTHQYKLFELDSIADFQQFINKHTFLKGLNVTIPYKTSIIPYLTDIDETASKVGAVNTILIEGNKKIGYNTDCIGFEKAYINILNQPHTLAVILGSGGASKAVQFVLKKFNIPYVIVSRTHKGQNFLQYEELNHFKEQVTLLINTTPVGMFPDINQMPYISEHLLIQKPIVIDIIYNPQKTLLLIKAEQKGCFIANGMELLKQQAYESWKIWGLI